MAETISLHVVVAHLDDALGSERHEGQVLAGTPSAARRAARGAGELLLASQAHGWPSKGRDERLQLVEECARRAIGNAPTTPTSPARLRRRGGPGAGMPIRSSIALVGAVPGDDAVGGSLVLDLDHHALVRLDTCRPAAWPPCRRARPPELGEPPAATSGSVSPA